MRILRNVGSAPGQPIILTESFASIAQHIENTASGDETTLRLYDLPDLYFAASSESKTRLFTDFKAAPFVEPATGATYLRARWYDASTGTFISPDPLAHVDSSNVYAAFAGDPVNRRDPSGLQSAIPLDVQCRQGRQTIGCPPAVELDAAGEAFATNFVVASTVGVAGVLYPPLAIGLLAGGGANMAINVVAEEINYRAYGWEEHWIEAAVVGASRTLGLRDIVEGRNQLEIGTASRIDEMTSRRMEYGAYGALLGGITGGILAPKMPVRVPAPVRKSATSGPDLAVITWLIESRARLQALSVKRIGCSSRATERHPGAGPTSVSEEAGRLSKPLHDATHYIRLRMVRSRR